MNYNKTFSITIEKQNFYLDNPPFVVNRARFGSTVNKNAVGYCGIHGSNKNAGGGGAIALGGGISSLFLNVKYV